MDEIVLQSIKESQLLIHKSTVQYFHLWKLHIFLTWRWWLSLFLAVAPWLFWFKYRKQESTDRLLYVGFLIMIIASGLDFFGLLLGLWFYPVDVIPITPAYIPFDLCVLPVIIMFLIQIKPTLSKYIKAFLFAGVNAFIAEPLLIYIKLYGVINWSHWYSFLIYHLYLFNR